MPKRLLPWIAGVLALVLATAPAVLAATFTITVNFPSAGASTSMASASNSASGGVYQSCDEVAGSGSCTVQGVSGQSYAILGSQTLGGAVYDAVYLGGAVGSSATVTLKQPSVIPTTLNSTLALGSPSPGQAETVTATVYGAAYTTPIDGTLVTFTGGPGLTLSAASGYGTTVAGNVYGGTVGGEIQFTADAATAGTYEVTATYPGTGQALATIPITFQAPATVVTSSSGSSSSSTGGAPVGPTGGTLACTDGSFSASVPAGAVPAGESESCGDQASLPSGAPSLPDHTVALSNYVSLTGPAFNQAVLATLKFDPSALNGMSADRVEVFAIDPGQWVFLPTTVNASAGTVQVSVKGDQTLAVLADTQTFPDVPSSYWARAYIATMLGAGAIDGFPDGSFQPGGLLTRAQFVKMLAVVDQLAPDPTGTTPFSDVAPGDWFGPYVAAAYGAGLVEGVSATSFDPNAGITREQMAVLLARALRLAGTASLSFSDASQVDAWALSGVQAAVAAGYLSGFPDGTFQPLATTTRDQATKVLSLIITKRAPGAATAASVSSIDVAPSPIAAAGSLAAGQTATLTLTARNAAGGAVPNATLYLSFAAATGGGSATAGSTPLSTTTQAFTTNAAGQVSVAYTAPTTLPATGSDTLTVSTGPAGTGTSSTDSYSFGTSGS